VNNDRVASVEWKFCAIRQKNCELFLYYVEFQVIAADLDWNSSALSNTLRMGLLEEIKHSIQ